jgi:hypothetical protein
MHQGQPTFIFDLQDRGWGLVLTSLCWRYRLHTTSVYWLLLHCCNQNTWENNFNEEKFIFFLSFKGFSPCMPGPMYLGRSSWWREHVVELHLHLMADRKQREGIQEGARVRYRPKGPIPSVFLPSTRSHLPVSTMSQNAATSWEPSIQCKPLEGGILHIQILTVNLCASGT